MHAEQLRRLPAMAVAGLQRRHDPGSLIILGQRPARAAARRRTLAKLRRQAGQLQPMSWQPGRGQGQGPAPNWSSAPVWSGSQTQQGQTLPSNGPMYIQSPQARRPSWAARMGFSWAPQPQNASTSVQQEQVQGGAAPRRPSLLSRMLPQGQGQPLLEERAAHKRTQEALSISKDSSYITDDIEVCINHNHTFFWASFFQVLFVDAHA